MNSRRQTTLSDIAQEVGVSTATVSRVLGNAPGHRAGKDTRRTILEVAERLSYQPNVAARALSTGQAPLIGVVMPSLAAEQFPAIIAEEDEALRTEAEGLPPMVLVEVPFRTHLHRQSRLTTAMAAGSAGNGWAHRDAIGRCLCILHNRISPRFGRSGLQA